MLPSSQRLTIHLFKSAIEKGKIFHSSLFTARLVKVEGISRFGVSVSKKIAKSAVERNKIRRRVYSALRELYPRISPSVHGVFIMKAPVLTSSFDEIKRGAEDFFVKTGLLK